MLDGSLVLAVNYAGPRGLTFPVSVCDPCPSVDVRGEVDGKIKNRTTTGCKVWRPSQMASNWEEECTRESFLKVR